MTIKKICFIGGGLAGGGQERALTSMANYFAGKGFNVSIINLFKTEQFFELNKNIKLYWPKANRKSMHWLHYAIKMIPYLRSSIKQAQPDILLSYGEWFNPFVIFSTRFMNVPLIVLDRMGPQIKYKAMVRIPRKLFYRFANGVIVQTRIAAELVQEKTRAKNIGIVPNPINTIETSTNEKKNQLISVGRLSKEKGHSILLKAFTKISDKNWTLHLIGDGPERKNLETEAEKLGIRNQVIFQGHLKNFNKLLGESEIFVLPSFYEGFPNALLEAMSVPLACISSNCVAGPSDIIEHGKNGLLVETGNVDELASALEQLITDKELRDNLAREAYKVRETYDFEKIADMYQNFIMQTIEK